MKKIIFGLAVLVGVLVVLAMALPITSPLLVLATSSGPNNGGAFANDNTVGTIDWSNPSSANISDDSYATASLGSSAVTHYLKATGFGFNISAGATINGIEVLVERNGDTGSKISDNSVRLVKNGTISGNDKSAAGTWPASDGNITYGGSSDLWGLNWTYSDINSANFGFVISAKHDSSGSTKTASVDCIRITVYYTILAATASSNSPVCEGATIELYGGPNGMTSYNWTGPGGWTSGAQNATRPNATLAIAGNYTLTVTDSSNSTATNSTSVTVNAKPTATASSNSPVCEGATIELYGGPGGMASYNWTGPGGWTSSAQNATRSNATLAMAGNYTLTVTNGSGCTATNSTSVTVNAKPTASASSNSPVSEGATIELYGGPSGMTSYNWTGPGGWTSGAQNATRPNATTNMTGTYTLTVTNSNGCTASNTTSVTVGGAQPHAWPTTWIGLNTDPKENGCDDFRNIYDTNADNYSLYYATDSQYLYFRMETADPPGWPSAASSGKARYKWWFNTAGTPAYIQGNSVYDAEFLLMLEDLTDNNNDPSMTRDQLGELTLLDDLSNAGFTTRWDSANPPHYTTDNAQTPPTGNSSWWRRVLGTGTPGAGGPQGVTGPDIGYRIDDNTTGGYFVDMYVSWAALGNPSSLCMVWSTDNQNTNLDQASACDCPTQTSCISLCIPPNADFHASNNTTCVNGTITFTDDSTWSPTSWNWTFGDGGTSTTQNATHSYASAGTYNVTLTVSNACGSDNETKTNYITVGGEAPVAAFNATPTSGCAPLTVNFTDQSTGSPANWSWTFGDGGTSTAQNPSHQYANTGSYNVTLTVNNACGSDDETKTNYITVGGEAPVAAFNATPTSGCAPLTVNFTDQSTGNPANWSWTFGDGGTSNFQNPSHNYTSAGTYNVILTVTNACGSDDETQTNYITVGSPPTANFSANVTSGCAPLTVQFTDTSTGNPTSWNWNFGDGSNSTLQSPSYQYPSAGTYNVSLTVSNTCGNDTKTQTNYITVGSPPTANFSANVTSGCAPLTVQFTDTSTGSPTSWSWNFTGGNPSSANTQGPHTVTYNSAGTYNVTLTVSNACGSNTTTQTNYITVGGGAPVAAFNATPTSGCAPLTVNFTDQSTGNPSSWSWTFGDGDTSTDQSPSHQYANAGTYNVTLTVINNCGNNTLTITDYITAADCGGPSLTITKSASPSPVEPGGTLTYNITVTNTGSANATGVTVVDDYDETILNITDADGGINDGDTITWDGGITIPAGEQISYTVTATVSSTARRGSTFYNTASVTCTEGVSNFTLPIPTTVATRHYPSVGGCPRMKYLTGDWDGNINKKPLYNSNGRLTQDFLVTSPDGKYSLLLKRGTRAPIVDGTRYYLIIIGELEDIPPLPQNTIAIVAVNITPTGAVFDRDIILTLRLNQTQLPKNASNVTMAYYDDVNEAWVPLESTQGEQDGVLTISTPINHFSIFGVLVKLASTPPTPPPSAAHFVASGLSTVPSGESVTIAANIVNDGGQSGNYTVELKLNGETVDTRTVTLGAGQSQPVSFTRSGLDYGHYDVDVAGLSGEFTVTASRTINWWLIVGIIVAIGLIIWGVVWIRRRRKARQEA